MQSNRHFSINFAWLLGSESIVRISRLVTAVLIARYVGIAELGIAAMAMATYELTRVLANNGFGLKIIRAGDGDVDALSNTVYLLNWLWAAALFVLQLPVAWLAAKAFGQVDIVPMFLLLAAGNLMIPLSLVHVFRLQRDQRLKEQAIIDSSQVIADNVLTAVLAVAGFGAWAIVLPKLLVLPVWVFCYRRCEDWCFNPAAGFVSLRNVFSDTRAVLTSESARAVKNHADVLILGRFVSPELLGLYYFAKNNGLGISLALIQAAANAALPRLAEIRRKLTGDAFRSSATGVFRLAALVVLPVIGLQALAAPWYVPVVFGEQWLPAVPVLILLCLSAMPRIFGDLSTQLLRANNRSDLESRLNVLSTPVFLAAVVCGACFGLLWSALAICVFQWIYHGTLACVAYRRIIQKESSRGPKRLEVTEDFS